MDAYKDQTDFFPRIDPYDQGTLKRDARHALYWEQSGNPSGVPVLFLHGGPGAGASPAHRRFFDPRFYRIVVFDQRGAGRSTPYGDTVDNTTPHLIEDIEALRAHLGIERWMVFGGSWGSLLALVYGGQYPDRCLGFVLRGIFLGRASEQDWFLYGMRTVYPEAWRAFAGFIPDSERGDLMTAYHRRLMDPDPAVHMPAGRAWSLYESACSHLIPPNDSMGAGSLALARIEAHYFVNNMFLPETGALPLVEKLRALPCTIVQGRYDIVCPIVTADDLARAWPEAEYVIVPDAGHSAMEPGIRAALIRATEAMKARLSP